MGPHELFCITLLQHSMEELHVPPHHQLLKLAEEVRIVILSFLFGKILENQLVPSIFQATVQCVVLWKELYVQAKMLFRCKLFFFISSDWNNQDLSGSIPSYIDLLQSLQEL